MVRLSRVIPLTRRSLASVALALALFAGSIQVLPHAARAADFESGDIVVTTDSLNLRSDAGTDGTVRQILDRETELEIVQGPRADDGMRWYQVTVVGSGAKGWVAADYISGDDAGAPVEFEDALGVRVTDGPINVRESAGTNGIIKTTLDTGAEVPVYGAGTIFDNANGFDWIKILYGNGSMGWVATDFVEPLSSSPNLGSDDGWGNAVGGTVIDGPVNVRDNPSLDADIVGTLADGRVIQKRNNTDLVSADGHTWMQINSLYSEPHDGWVAIDFLQPLASIPCGDGPCYPEEIVDLISAEQAVVVDGPVNFRADPGLSGEVLLKLDDGDYVFMVKGDGKFTEAIDGYYWVEASVGGEDGYIAVNFLEPVE